MAISADSSTSTAVLSMSTSIAGNGETLSILTCRAGGLARIETAPHRHWATKIQARRDKLCQCSISTAPNLFYCTASG